MKRRKRLWVLAGLVALIMYLWETHTVYVPPQKTTPYMPALGLPESNLESGQIGSPLDCASPHATPSPLSLSSTPGEASHTVFEGSLFTGVDQRRLSGNLTDLPPEKRIPVNEELKYEILWNGLHVGDATLSTTYVTDDTSRILLAAHIESRNVVDAIYPVDDFIESVVQLRNGNTLTYSQDTRAGRHQRQDTIVIDPINHIATYKKFKEGEQRRFVTYDVPQSITDPLSVVYKVRSMDLELFPESLTLNILSNKRVATAKLDRGGTTSIKVPLGTFDCQSLQLDMDYPGLFEEVPEGSATAHFESTTQILVKAEVSLAAPIGDVDLVLKSWKKGQLP